MAEPSTRAKWRALRSVRTSTPKKCLTPPTLSETPVDFSQQRQIQPANGFPLEHRLDRAGPNNSFVHSEKRLPGKRCVIAQAKEIQLIQRNCLHIEIEDGIRVGGLNTGRRWVRRVNHLHITTGAPPPAECT